MRFALGNVVLAASALALIGGAPAGATDVPIPGKIAIIKNGKLFKLVAKPVGAFTLPGAADPGSPLVDDGEVNAFDLDGSGVLNDDLTAGTWAGLGNPTGSKGYKYSNTAAPSGGAVKLIIMKAAVMKILAKDDGTLDGPLGGSLGIELITGTDKRCAEFGGTDVVNDPGLVKRKDAAAPAVCPFIVPPFVCAGCNNDSFIAFETGSSPGDCGDVIDSMGVVAANLACGGLYTGGGGNTVPLPYAVPDQEVAVMRITTCAGAVTTLGGTTSGSTGSNRTCTNPGCLFGAPLAIPNPNSTPTSVCVINEVTQAASGTWDCGTGAVNLDLPLSSRLFLTGDTATDLGSTIPGIQPCPLCSGGTCIGGPNNGMACVPATSTLGGNPAYPTSNDCPPDPMFDIGALPIAFSLTSGSLTWSGTDPTNDTGNTTAVQTRAFSGYCRDWDATGAFANPAQQCWENGMAVGPACSGTFEACQQRTNGAFGPAGGANRTITIIGNGMSILGSPAPMTLVSIFSIAPTFDATVDATGDLPGPGAVSLPVTAQSCASASACP